MASNALRLRRTAWSLVANGRSCGIDDIRRIPGNGELRAHFCPSRANTSVSYLDEWSSLEGTVCMTCVRSCIQTLVRVAVISNGIGQVQRLNYLCDIQRRIEQGKSLEATVCMDVLNIRYSGHTSLIILTTTLRPERAP